MADRRLLEDGTSYRLLEDGTSNRVLERAPFRLVASSYISASAADATTARLSAPSGKTTGDFDAGWISDDTNPLPTVDITADGYTEVEWCIDSDALLVTDDVYEFRVVTSADVALDTYTATPTWTVGAALNDYTLTATGSSYAITGATVGLLFGALLVPTSGAYAITGTNAGLSVGRAITAAAGSYAITGTATTLTLTPAFYLEPSANIAGSAATATTARLTAPSGKTTGDFDAGLISDDTNPLPTIDITSDGYTELEWCVQASPYLTDTDVFQFRVVDSADTVLDTYTVTPQWTVGSAITDYPLTIDAGSYTITGDDVYLRGPPAALGVAVNAAGAVEGLPFTTQPVVYAVGTNFEQSWNNEGFVITASLHAGTLGTLGGTVTAALDQQGFAQWVDLSIDTAQADARIDFDGTGVSQNNTVLDVWPRLVVGAGTYTITGSAVGLTATRLLSPASGTYTITGTDVAFVYFNTLVADSGVYTITGTSVALTPQSPGGTYVITGMDVTLKRTLVLAVPTTTTYAIAGADVTLRYGAVVVAGSSSYTITGDVVDLVYDMAGEFNLPANAGSYVITGTAASLLAPKRIVAAPATYTISGTAVGLLRDSLLSPASGTYTSTGNTVSLIYTTPTDSVMVVDEGAYTLTGRPVDLRYGNTPPPDRDRWGRHHRCRPVIGGRR